MCMFMILLTSIVCVVYKLIIAVLICIIKLNVLFKKLIKLYWASFVSQRVNGKHTHTHTYARSKNRAAPNI